MSNPSGPVVLDVRTPAEYALGHLDGAQLLDFNGGDFHLAVPTLDPDADYLLYCRSGARSRHAAVILLDAGFARATNLGSLNDAAEATGLPIVVD